MPEASEILAALVMLWAVIDPIGTVPVFISATQGRSAKERARIARTAAIAVAGILLLSSSVSSFCERLVSLWSLSRLPAA